jgi:predicted transcriptional regulator
MNATIHQLEPKPNFGKMECSSCGASTDAACACGVAYVPAAERVAAAVKANPEKSNVAIAKDLGVSEKTVRNHRPTSDQSEVRTGLDGKARRMPKKAEPDDEDVFDRWVDQLLNKYLKKTAGRKPTPEEIYQGAAALAVDAQRLLKRAEGIRDTAREMMVLQ